MTTTTSDGACLAPLSLNNRPRPKFSSILREKSRGLITSPATPMRKPKNIALIFTIYVSPMFTVYNYLEEYKAKRTLDFALVSGRYKCTTNPTTCLGFLLETSRLSSKPTVSGLFSKAGSDKPLQKLLGKSLKLITAQKKQRQHNNKYSLNVILLCCFILFP